MSIIVTVSAAIATVAIVACILKSIDGMVVIVTIFIDAMVGYCFQHCCVFS